ncbi:MAG: hypothetical protein ABH951_02320 [Patescibacteria group bacterium]
MLKKNLFLFFILICVFFAFSAHAQIKSENISLSLNPEQPKANETVRASVSSYINDLNKALISWSLNGQIVVQGVGEKNFSFKTGENGIQTIIDVQIDTVEGFSIKKQAIISPFEIDLLWEANNSYVPPFYKGKASVPPEGTVKVVAMLNSNKSNSASYQWKLDGTSKQNSSGYGKNFYIFKKTYLDKNNKIEITASSLLGDPLGSGKIEVREQNPKIVFYKKDQLFGTRWQEALKNNFRISQEGETIVAEPYFISPKNINSSDLSFDWFLGGFPVDTPTIKNEITIKPESTNGSSKINVQLKNIRTMFLSGGTEINVNF